ncbi:MAG: DEAD/DEAH box helicase [Thermaerobacter sp.]|nr:DEAD/DEAH box helicase [Thermaerobacter sp.]
MPHPGSPSPPALALRPYQQSAIDAVQADVQAGYRRVLLHLPVGAGKTLVFAELARRWHQPTLVLVHREELLAQAVEKFRWVWPQAWIGVVRGREQGWHGDVVVATVQTLARQPHRLRRDRFRLAIVDECHHGVSSQWQTVLHATGFWPHTAPHHCLVGVTATLERTDQVDLHLLFEKTSYQLAMLDLIQAGYLSDLRALRITTAIDLDRVPRGADGEWDLEALAQVVDTPARNALIVQHWQRAAADRRTLVFATNVLHAQRLAAAFQRQHVRADWVAGSLPRTVRQARLHALHTGAIQVLVNVALLTEGYDEPRIDCIVMARPTESAIVYTQAIGRGTRLHPEKRDCLVLDFVDNSTRHALWSVGRLLGMEDAWLAKWSVREAARRQAGSTSGMGRRDAPSLVVPVTAQVQRIDLFGQSVFAWEQVGSRYRLPVRPGTYVWLTPTATDGRYHVAERSDRKPAQPLASALPLDFALGVAEDWARQQGDLAWAAKTAAWRSKPATEAQHEQALALGISLPADATRDHAERLLENARRERILQDPHAAWRKKPASAKALALLAKLGESVPENITAGDAADRIAHRLWVSRPRPLAGYAPPSDASSHPPS